MSWERDRRRMEMEQDGTPIVEELEYTFSDLLNKVLELTDKNNFAIHLSYAGHINIFSMYYNQNGKYVYFSHGSELTSDNFRKGINWLENEKLLLERNLKKEQERKELREKLISERGLTEDEINLIMEKV